jgi:flagellar hook-length control protein FliK
MVLPQSLPNSTSPEAAKASGSSRPGNEKSGESQFDAVSRSEHKRLEAKEARAAKSDSEKPDRDKADSEKISPEQPAAEKSADAKSTEGKPPATDPSGEEHGQNLAADDAQAEKVGKNPSPLLDSGSDLATIPPDEATIDSVPVTFAGLQSLVASAQTQVAATATAKGTGSPSNSQGLPFIQGSMMSMSGLNGVGKTGAINLQTSGQNGSASGTALTETLLAGVTADGAKAADSPLLQNALRFQGALESVSAQANAVNTPKMAPDAPILRGYTTSIDVPVSHAEWGDKMAGKLTWLTARNMSVAEIHLTPPDMGPMEVRVQVQQDQANISVHSANPVVREQLELHSHRLRDMLNEQGLSLEQFDVSDSGRDQAGDGEAGGDHKGGQGVIAEAEMEDAGAELRSLDLTWKGEVDIFA